MVGPDGIDDSILPSQLILLFFGEICPSSLHQKNEKKTLITAILKEM